MSRRWAVLLEVVGLVAVLGIWAVVTALAQSYFFPPLQAIAAALRESWQSGSALADVLPSVQRLLVGYTVACVVGVAAGTLIGLIRWLSDAVDPVVQFLRALPPPVLIPFGILVLGVGDAMKIAIIGFGAVWPVLLNTIDGARSVDPTLLDTARGYRVPWSARLWHVILPAALPQVMAGMRTALAIALALMVISEMVASTNGIGYFILESQRTFAIPDMWAGIVVIGLLGYLVNLLFVRLERRLLRWHAGMRGQVAE